MTARILVVDDVPANVKLLEARLSAEYFEVLTANSGPEALDICDQEKIDIILLDVMMPGMDGFEVCRRLKANPETQHVPVIMVTALDLPSDKVQGLEAGADDFLTKPVDEVALMTRVKNLARLKVLTDEMIVRYASGEQIGFTNNLSELACKPGNSGRILLVDDDERSARRVKEGLQRHFTAFVEPNPEEAIKKISEAEFDLVIVSLSLKEMDGLRLCSTIRTMEQTRHLPIVIIVNNADDQRLLKGLDLGVNDYIIRPIDRNELLARVRTQISRKRFADQLRTRLEESVEMAITDSLTGLFNRRYMEKHLHMLVEESLNSGTNLSLLILDIDNFKIVNDTYGHDAGDMVLEQFATRLRRNVRGVDLVCRLGGEEFVVVMPETFMKNGFIVAERLRQAISSKPFNIGRTQDAIEITASVGVAALEKAEDCPETVLKRADQALYAAKREGRNRVVSEAA